MCAHIVAPDFVKIFSLGSLGPEWGEEHTGSTVA